jgi:hypothetical protein
MPSTTGESQRVQHDRDGRRLRRPADEPRKSDLRGAEITTGEPGPHAGFDADLNPIDDELINTHGSER